MNATIQEVTVVSRAGGGLLRFVVTVEVLSSPCTEPYGKGRFSAKNLRLGLDLPWEATLSESLDPFSSHPA